MNTLIARLMEDVSSAPDAAVRRERFRAGFGRLQSRLLLHPDFSMRASATFEQAAGVARGVAEVCLPLAMGIVMHLYPLCALQCVPLPLLSRPRLRRAHLVRNIQRCGLILANAGSERAQGVNAPVRATMATDGVLVDGVFEYVSLASVADLVLFEAPLADGGGIAFCAADLCADSAQVGAARFQGRMELSDTRAVSFVRHLVPHARCFVVPAASTGLHCIRDYQRCWFHLLLAEIHLARIDLLNQSWNLESPGDGALVRDELVCLREYCLRLIDTPFAPGHLESLSHVTATMKLRVSQLAQAAAARLRVLGPEGCQDADELTYICMQPTADAKIRRRMADDLARVRSVRLHSAVVA